MHKVRQALWHKRNVKIKKGTMWTEFYILMFQIMGKEHVLSRMALRTAYSTCELGRS